MLRVKYDYYVPDIYSIEQLAYDTENIMILPVAMGYKL